jgi:hypothetical protein
VSGRSVGAAPPESATPESATSAVARRTGFGAAFASLMASSTTLVCCALPAMLVAIGAGAALSSVVSAVPQLVWLSEHKEPLFAVAGALLLAAGVVQWRNRRAPCPADPVLGRACLRMRKVSVRVFIVSVLLYAVGGWFAFIVAGSP